MVISHSYVSLPEGILWLFNKGTLPIETDDFPIQTSILSLDFPVRYVK